MIIKVGILQLLLLNAADQTFAFSINQKTTSTSITSSSASTSINTSINSSCGNTCLKASIDPNDPYAGVLEAYQKKKQMGGVDIPLPPPAIADSVPTSTADIVQAVNDAASTAIEASNQASEAAASLSITDVASNAAAAAASAVAMFTSAATNSDTTTTTTNAASERVPNFAEYISKIGTIKPSIKSSVPSDTKEKLILLKNNLISSIPTPPTSSSSGEVVAAKAAGVAAIFKATPLDMNMDFSFDLQNIDFDWSKFTGDLQLDEYGAWYVTAFSLLFALNQREDGRIVAAQEYEESLQEARDKAKEAAMAAGVAAEGARQAKELVMSLPKSVSSDSGVGEALLENGKIRSLKVENELMQMEVKRLRIETEEQKNAISNLVKKSIIQQQENSVPVKLEIPVGKSTMQRDPAEEKKFLDILKDMDQVNASSKAAAKETATVVMASEEAAAKKPAKKARAPRKAVKKDVVVAEAAVADVAVAEAEVTTTTVEVPAKKVATSKAPKKARKSRAKKATQKEVEPEVVVVADAAESSPFFAEAEDATVEKAAEALKVIEAAEVSFKEAMAKSAKEATVIEELKSIVSKKADAESKVIEAAKEALVESTEESAVIEELMSILDKPDAGEEEIVTVEKVIEAAEVSFKKAAVIDEELENIFTKADARDAFASEAPAKKAATKANAPRRKMGAAKAPASGAAKAPASGAANENPWGSLKESTLKRRTVAQLTEYLNERKVDVEGLSKIDMVGTIQKL